MTGPPDVERVFREEYGRAVAVLVRHFGDIDLAEEAVQDAFAEAARRWPRDGTPPRPAGWIITTARNRMIDRFRREATREDRQVRAALSHHHDEPDEEGAVRDDRLRLIFTCCHPALAPTARVALTLRLLGGLTTAEIARATGWSARICARRRSASAACWPSRCPTSRRSSACSRSCCSCTRAGRPVRLRTATSCRSPGRTGAGGTTPSSPRARISSGRACAATGRGRTRSRRRSTPSTATRRPPPPRTGGRSSTCTTTCWRSRRTPSSR